MNADVMIVFGVVAILASLPALLNAFSSGRPPGVWAVLLLAGFALVAVVLSRNPSTYSFETLPDAFARVIQRLI